jgi:hypothetical protein
MATTSSHKPHFRIIVLVLSSYLTALVQNNRQVWKQYMHIHPNVKVFLVYGDSFQGTPSESDLVYMDIEENYNPGMLKKTLRALQFVDQNYTYDFMLRTNLGTFWDFPRLLTHVDSLPSELCYSGDGPFESIYVSGTDTLVNGYMVREFIKHQHELNYQVPEDKAMGLIFHGVLGAPFRKSRISFMEKFLSPDEGPIVECIRESMKHNADHYRVKNDKGGRNIVDIACYVFLCREIYGLDISPIQWIK